MNPSLVVYIKAAFTHWNNRSLLQSFIGGLHHCTIHSIVHCIIGCFIHCMKAPFTQTIIYPLHQSYNIKRCNHLKQHCIKDVFHHSSIISKQYSIDVANHHFCIAANHRFHRLFSSVSEKFANFVSATSSRGDQGLTKRNSKLCFCAYKLRSSTRKPPCPVLRTGESSHLATRYLYWNEPLV